MNDENEFTDVMFWQRRSVWGLPVLKIENEAPGLADRERRTLRQRITDRWL